MKIALTMIVKNESENLKKCLDAVVPLVDEIIIVDTGSDDDTVDIARSFGAEVFDFKWCDDFAEARNFALSKSNCDWNLILDADEIITNVTKKELIFYAKSNVNAIGNVIIRSKFEDDCEIKYFNSKISRFAPKGVRFSGKIHEQLDSNCRVFDTSIVLEHSGYYKKDKTDRNLGILLKALDEDPEDLYYLYQTARALSGAKRHLEANKYFEKGMRLVTLDMPYAKNFLVSYMYNCISANMVEKILELEDIGKKKFADTADFNFVYGIFCMEIAKLNPQKYMSYIMEIEKSYLKCLEIGESSESSVEGTGTYLAAYNLGVFYEVTGNEELAIKYYEKSASYEYELAKSRLEILIKK